MSDFTQLVDLAFERLGGAVLTANDDFFAPKENLLKDAKPIFIEDKYTDRGKWMDGWETRRRRTPGHDWCIIRLGLLGIIRGVIVDTSFFRGNFPSHCSIDACAASYSLSPEELQSPGITWRELLPKSELRGDAQNPFAIADPYRCTHLRFNIFPDGGVARLRVHGEVLPDWRQILAANSEINLSAIEHGGRALTCSDMFYSAPQNLLMPYAAANMGDGWETKRRRGPGHDWTILKLGVAGEINRIELDTAHFKGNYPESCSLEACAVSNDASPDSLGSSAWHEILPRTQLCPDRLHLFEKELRHSPAATHIRFNIFPDGGVSRLRIFGQPTKDGRSSEALRFLNSLDPAAARAELLNCCGSSAWADAISKGAPFASSHHIIERAEAAFASLKKEDWLEAFRHHPRLGEKESSAETSNQAKSISEQEQSGIAGAQAGVMAELAAANRAYEERFGHIFIVCASGKSSAEVLSMLRQRMSSNQETELRVAAEEQRRITRLRLEKLLNL
ncbi:MAG: allantoicase [Candidatus Acidiferrales bacterium]